MIHADEGSGGLEHIPLDDYRTDDDDYISDTLDQSMDMTMSFDVTNTIKIEDEDDIQKECRQLRNAKRTERRHHVVEQHQRGQSNLYDCSTSDLRTIINVGRGTCNVIIAKQQERDKVEAYSRTSYHIPLEYLDTTRKRKLEAGEQPTRRKKTLSSKENASRRLSTSDAHGTRRASIPPSNAKPSKGPWELRHSMKTAKKGDGTARIIIYS
jgi:hypothetical protein